MWKSILLLVALAGCAERWERPGATEAEADLALAECTGVAARLVPPAMVQVMVSPPHWEPGQRICRTHGSRTVCETRPARFFPAQYGWRDANAGQRAAVRSGCMAERGFTYQGLRPLRLF